MTEIKGYSVLNEEQKQVMNMIKTMEQMVGKLHKDISSNSSSDLAPCHRSLALAKTNLQEGFMWFSRAIAKPTDFYK